MSRIGFLLRFANLSDVRRAVADPGKAVRVLRKVVRDTPSAASRLDRDESRRRRREVLARLFSTTDEEVEGLLTELDGSYVTERVQDAQAVFEDKPYSMGGMRFNGRTLYVVTRLLRPTRVLELGVANGLSTAYLLAALERNGDDVTVHGLDLPQFESQIRERRGRRGLKTGGLIPDDREVGWVAPARLKEQFCYQLHVGDVGARLPALIEEVGPPDLVVYDASKDAEVMRTAYERSVDSLAPGGVLMSDDVLVNDAFPSVMAGLDGEWGTVHNSGVFRKPSPAEGRSPPGEDGVEV